MTDPDYDEYANFATDYEKYEYDQQRFKGMEEAKKARLQVKLSKAKQPKNPKKTVVKKSNISQTRTPAPRVPKIRIDFDNQGCLWYSYLRDDVGDDGVIRRIYLAERAVFHHWIRAELSMMENSKGSYATPNERKRGLGNWDITCFNNMQRYWGASRPNYAPVMFEYEPSGRMIPPPKVGNLYHRGLLVIDYWLAPVKDFRQIPLVLSSVIEGAFLEPALRIRSDMGYRDIRARVPPIIEVVLTGETKKDDPITVLRSVYGANTFSNRARRFREKAGGITWRPEPASAAVKAFMETCASQAARNNKSTKECTDMTKAEIAALRRATAGTGPQKAKKSASVIGKAEWKRKHQKPGGESSRAGAGLAATTMEDSWLSDEEEEDMMEFEDEE